VDTSYQDGEGCPGLDCTFTTQVRGGGCVRKKKADNNWLIRLKNATSNDCLYTFAAMLITETKY